MLKFSSKKAQKQLEDAVKKINKNLKVHIDAALSDLAHSAFASIQSKAQQELKRTRQDYLSGLKMEKIGENSYLITLEGDWPNALESGFSPYNLTDRLLQSNKTVGVGKRSGESWVQTSKEGNKYAHVPMQRHSSGTSDMAQAIKKMTAKNLQGFDQKLTQTFKDSSGNPLSGKVAVGRSDEANYDRLVKYQKVGQNNNVQNVYINYRTISEKGKPWQHPGWKGAHFFEQAEKDLMRNIDQIIKRSL